MALGGMAALLYIQTAVAFELNFKAVPVNPRSRIDAIAYLGNGIIIAGTRLPAQPGYIHRSKDFGETWQAVGDITGADYITCLRAGGNGLGYLLTGRDVHLWKTVDYGETWQDQGKICNATNHGRANAYGLIVTRQGTVLVADADGGGGHIHRSIDQGRTWQDIGRISPLPLYRLNEARDGWVINGWAGHIYKSTDDGLTWKDMGKLADSALYAIEYLEDDGTLLIGTASGRVLLSKDNGATWLDRGVVGDEADDFAWLGGTRVLYSTGTGTRSLYISENAGFTWKNIGCVPTEPGDWLDHFIYIHDRGVCMVVGGTNKGYILHARIPDEAPAQAP